MRTEKISAVNRPPTTLETPHDTTRTAALPIHLPIVQDGETPLRRFSEFLAVRGFYGGMVVCWLWRWHMAFGGGGVGNGKGNFWWNGLLAGIKSRGALGYWVLEGELFGIEGGEE